MARVLVADDEEGIRAFVATTLEREGHEVETARDGVDAATQLEHRVFDVLITDLKMPRMDGMSLLEKVRRERPETEVIVLTAYGKVETAVEAMRRGAFDFVEKPISSPAALRHLVARACERRAPVPARESTVGDVSLPMTYGDPVMRPVVEAFGRVAPTQATVLLLGESGTGKEVAARFVHSRSSRASGPFVAVNCAVLSESLLESELFGHEKGAFTGAHAQRRGRLELAHGGTLFLDEVAELRPSLQAKLLRVLQERQYERVGGGRTLSCDVRWIAATNRDLGAMMAQGEFREDLYHRLAVFPVRLPPLRARPDDVPKLAEVLLREVGREIGRPDLTLTTEASARLVAHDWPGNVRELRNVLERAAILATGRLVGPEQLWLDLTPGSAPVEVPQSLRDLERAAIERALSATGGNRRKAADLLGIGLRTLYDKLKRYDLG